MNKAKAVKMDEFYTQLPDVESELNNYLKFFENKTIYCCCDNPLQSNFSKYFINNFERLKLNKLISSCSSHGDSEALVLEYNHEKKKKIRNLVGNGDFLSEECYKFFDEADIIVTNPPFSKTKKMIQFIDSINKKFIIVGNRNLITSDIMFEMFMTHKIRFGFGFKGNTALFNIPQRLYGHYSKDIVRNENNIVRFRNVTWFTNLEINVPPRKRLYTKKYDPNFYQKFDQYDAINIDKISDIPIDYPGKMGVPITILDRFDYERFILLGIDRTIEGNNSKTRFSVNGKSKYVRVIIKNRNVHDQI